MSGNFEMMHRAQSGESELYRKGQSVGSCPQLSRKFVARRISEGETGRLKEQLKCQACGKGYKHVSSLAKHLWEHTPEWNVTSKLLISKHQQVQLLEAASILVSMNEEDDDEPETEGHGAAAEIKSERSTTALDLPSRSIPILGAKPIAKLPRRGRRASSSSYGSFSQLDSLAQLASPLDRDGAVCPPRRRRYTMNRESHLDEDGLQDPDDAEYHAERDDDHNDQRGSQRSHQTHERRQSRSHSHSPDDSPEEGSEGPEGDRDTYHDGDRSRGEAVGSDDAKAGMGDVFGPMEV